MAQTTLNSKKEEKGTKVWVGNMMLLYESDDKQPNQQFCLFTQANIILQPPHRKYNNK